MIENIQNAKKVLEQICAIFDARGWTYEKDEDGLELFIRISGMDIPMPSILCIDAERHVIRFLSPLPFTFSEEQRLDGALAACHATYGLADGCFDYTFDKGRITFRLTACYLDRDVSEELLQYMIDCSCTVVDHFNDKFFALSSGQIDIDEFIKD